MDISIVIPAYNEEKGIKEVIEKLKESIDKNKYNYEIIVVDDASTDKTGEIANNSGVIVIRHPANLGYGSSLVDGFNYAKYDYIAMIDADGSYPPEEINKLLEYISSFDMVIGARQGPEYRGTFIKYPARIVFKLLAEYTAGVKIPDVNSGLRIFKKSALKKVSLPLLCRGFSFSTTMTLSFLLSGLLVKYVPINYISRKGYSKVRYIRDTLRSLQALTEVIIYYNPLKIVLLICTLPFIFSVMFLFVYINNGLFQYLLLSLISLYFSLLIFVIGLLMDLVRMNRG